MCLTFGGETISAWNESSLDNGERSLVHLDFWVFLVFFFGHRFAYLYWGSGDAVGFLCDTAEIY